MNFSDKGHQTIAKKSTNLCLTLVRKHTTDKHKLVPVINIIIKS